LRETQVVVVAVVVVYRSRQSYSYKPISYLLCVVSEASKSERRSWCVLQCSSVSLSLHVAERLIKNLYGPLIIFAVVYILPLSTRQL